MTNKYPLWQLASLSQTGHGSCDMQKSAFVNLAAGIATVFALSACSSDADVASRNLSTAADQFQIARRIVFFNGITDRYLLTIEGLCSLGNRDDPGELTVTCKTEPGKFKKHFLGLSDNVSYLVEQISAEQVSAYQYRLIFKPQSIIPDIDLKLDGGELLAPSRPAE